MSLGCADYRVAIHARDDLTRPLVEIPWASIQWSRVLDETSEATITAGAGCCSELVSREVRAWSHTLAIYRRPTVGRYRRMWSGPLMVVRDSALSGLTLTARDLSAWLDRRLIHEDQYHFDADLADIYQALWDDAMAPDPVPDYALSITAAGVTGEREILADQHRIAGDELRELGRTGLDWTVIDREHIVGPEEINTPAIATLIDSHFVTPPEIVEDGTGQANSWIVTGAGGGAEGDEVVGTASATPGPEGLLEAVAQEASILDAGSADDAAQTRLDRSVTVQRFASEGVLATDAPVAFDNLVPGARVRLALSGRCLPILTTARLGAVRGVVGRTDQGVSESISVSLQPLGTTVEA